MFKFSVDFNFDILKFLFSSKGKTHNRGKVYEKEDFDGEFFPSGWDVAYYPITMKPIFKYGPNCFSKSSDGILTQKSRSFYETLHVTLIKK